MSQLRINLSQGSVVFNFAPEAAQKLQKELSQLLQTLKVIAANNAKAPGQASKQKSLEYSYTGDVFLEIFCNPNIYPSPFAAKVLLTIRDEKMRLTTETELTTLVADVEQYLAEQN